MTEASHRLSERMGGDHEALDARWQLFLQTSPADRSLREERYDAFRSGLTRHILLEEEVLFPRMLSEDLSQRGLVDRLREEHRAILDVLARLAERVAAGSGAVDDATAELENVLGEHNAREEAYAYPWLDDHLSPSEVESSLRRLRPPDPA